MRRRPTPPSALTAEEIVAAVEAHGLGCLERLGVSPEDYRQARHALEWPERRRRLLAMVTDTL